MKITALVENTTKKDWRTEHGLSLFIETERHKIYVGNDLRYPKYDGTIGIKTGYTPQAGGCLVAACEKDSTRLLSVVMECTDMGRFADTIKLFNWGFENYKTYTVLHGGYSFGDVKVKHGEFNKVEAVLLTDVAYTLPADASVDIMSARAVLQESIKAPVKKGDDVGVITLYEGDEPVGTYRAVAAKSIAEGGLLSYFGIEDSTAKVIGRIALVAIVLLVLALATYVMIMRRKMKIKKARKARKLAQKQQEEAIKRAQWEHYYEGSKYRSSDEEK